MAKSWTLIRVRTKHGLLSPPSPSGDAAFVVFVDSPPDVYWGNEVAEIFNVPGLVDPWDKRHGLMLISDYDGESEV